MVQTRGTRTRRTPSTRRHEYGGCRPGARAGGGLSEEEQFYASLGGRCRRGFFKDVAWDEACLATAIDAFRVPDRRCYVPDDCGRTSTAARPSARIVRVP